MHKTRTSTWICTTCSDDGPTLTTLGVRLVPTAALMDFKVPLTIADKDPWRGRLMLLVNTHGASALTRPHAWTSACISWLSNHRISCRWRWTNVRLEQ
eukprot:1363145-Amorphochlora_amoeboformis.AAC.2